MTAAGLAEALGGHRSGAGWMACCPAHEDRSPSLSIADGGGKVLLKCFAGCEQRTVLDALKARGLWGGNGAARAEWREWRDGIRYRAEWGAPVCEYRYTDETGQHLYSVVRFEPKSFRPGYFDTGGRWVWRKHPQQVLYRAGEVAEAAIVFVVEGEKDAETLRAWGFCATTVAGGAQAPWLPSFTEALRGREVYILPDADLPGRRRAAQIARALLGAAAKIVILELPGAKDATEWFERGHSETEFISLVEGEDSYAL